MNEACLGHIGSLKRRSSNGLPGLHMDPNVCCRAWGLRSNTIDALLFVFGKRAKKMRLNKAA